MVVLCREQRYCLPLRRNMCRIEVPLVKFVAPMPRRGAIAIQVKYMS